MAQTQLPGCDDFDWSPVMDALIEHESKGNPNAVNGQYVGVLQIAPVLVKGVNQILASRGSSLRYTVGDRRNAQKSKEMFIIMMSKFNPEHDFVKAIRIWAGGPGYSVKGTQRHVNRVMAIMRRQAQQKGK
ncbi:MAG: hypothetical protein K5893_11335 [Prevotella sp.]|nr:hypothetical protein [Prevotella sp.]